MSSLTSVAIATRKIIRYGVFFLIFLIVGKITLDIGITVYKKLFPPPPPVPTVAFGKLPKLPFPEKERVEGLSFTLETAEGSLPKLSNQAKVFFMPKIASNLLSLDVAKQKAQDLGFQPQPVEVSSTIYRFPNSDAPSTLEMNIVTGIFSISYDLKTDPTAIDRKPPAPEVSASMVRAYLSGGGLLPEDLGNTTHEFLKIDGDKFVTALSLSESDLIKINFFRKDYEGVRSMTPDTTKANTWFMVSGARERAKQMVAAEYHYFPVDESKFSTYPIKTPDLAWKEFTEGQGYIANLGLNKSGDAIKIRRVSLGYYDGGSYMEFFQPIYVFEGDKGFVSYLPAVTADYYGE